MTSTFTVSVIDTWPKIKLILNIGAQVLVREVYYDIAESQFEPVLRDEIRKCVSQIVKQHKRS